MQNQNLNDKIKLLPSTSGVYFFVSNKGEILYIGKATSLRSRVRSYFASDILEKRSPLIAKMVGEARDIKFEKTDSVLEALILEAALIKKHQPPFNTAEKDQKSWNYVVITRDKFPKVLVVRERELTSSPNPLSSARMIRSDGLTRRGGKEEFILPGGEVILETFGPFPHATQLKEALKIVRRIFPFSDKCRPHTKACFNYQIGLCPGPCAGAISEKDYKKNIRHIVTFFRGKKKKLVADLKKEMKQYAKSREFEKAESVKRQIFALEHINDIALIKNEKHQISNPNFQTFRIEAYDISHTSGKNIVGVMTVVEGNEAKKSDYRMFRIKMQTGADDTRALGEILERRFKHTEWQFPDLLVVDGGVAQKNIAEKIVKENGFKIPVVSVVKDERHKPREIIGSKEMSIYKKQIILANSESHRFGLKYHRKLRDIVK